MFLDGFLSGCAGWHVRCTLLLVCACAPACATRSVPPSDPPAEPGRHRAALAALTVVNRTSQALTIAFRSATPPLQEVVIGKVAPGARAQLAPIPAGEPIILVARSADGGEFALAARSFPLDAEWTWDIPRDATFTKPGPAN